MATNEQQQPGNTVVVTLASIAAGGAACVGAFHGVSQNGTQVLDGVANQCLLDLSTKYWNLPVSGTNAGGNVAVAFGDQLYIAATTPFLISKIATGVPFGIAAGAVTSGATATISVRHGAI